MERPRVGLVWRGSPNPRDPRSRSLDIFSPLSKVRGVTFIALQKDTDANEIRQSGFGPLMLDFTNELRDFAETAALVENLDLVISVDTSVAHLAGALAKPTFVLIPRVPDFRWMLDRDDSPWYPTMRLFRQRVADDWSAPVAAVTEALKSLQERA
jgi:hypothetical protein